MRSAGDRQEIANARYAAALTLSRRCGDRPHEHTGPSVLSYGVPAAQTAGVSACDRMNRAVARSQPFPMRRDGVFRVAGAGHTGVEDAEPRVRSEPAARSVPPATAPISVCPRAATGLVPTRGGAGQTMWSK